MTAHIVFEAVDPERPATVSPRLIEEVIRGFIGFEGVIVSDDLSMEALSGSPSERARASLAAGCDLVLHCNGEPGEMAELAAGVGDMSADSAERLARAAAKVPAVSARLGANERQDMQARLDAVLAQVGDPGGASIEGMRSSTS